MYTTQGYMTAEDLYDYNLLHDLGLHPDCPGHQDDDGDTYFCARAEICPDEELEEL
jgi:hypothetical protein